VDVPSAAEELGQHFLVHEVPQNFPVVRHRTFRITSERQNKYTSTNSLPLKLVCASVMPIPSYLAASVSLKYEGHHGNTTGCLEKSFTMVFQILLCGECYEHVYT
jgi:hypothetical protein